MYLKNEVRIFLDERKITYTWVDHPPAYTIDDVMELGLDTGMDVAKNLFLRDSKGERHYLIVIRSDKKLNIKAFGKKHALGHLSFASEERLQKYLGLQKGAVTPLGVLNDAARNVTVYFDRDFLESPRIGVHPNENTASVYLSVGDLVKIIEAHGNALIFTDFPMES